ncbi:alpha/beta fold hydrolase [Microbacterium aurum]
MTGVLRGFAAGIAACLLGVAFAPVPALAVERDLALNVDNSAVSCDVSWRHSSAVDLDWGRTPVVVVHGWNGTALVDLADGLQSELGSEWATFAFDYRQANDRWPSDSGAADCLREYVLDLNAATGKPVYIVGHSMGGILARFAFGNGTSGAHLSDVVGGVVTVDTPHMGSMWGNSTLARILQEGWSTLVPFRSVGNAYQCLADRTRSGQLPPSCAEPPYVALSVPVTAVTGQVTVDRKLFGVTTHSVNMNGDGTVGTTSQGGYLNSAPQDETGTRGQRVRVRNVTCTTSVDALLKNVRGASHAASLKLFLALVTGSEGASIERVGNEETDLRVAEMFAAASVAADCGHVATTRYETTWKEVASALIDQNSNRGEASTWLYELRRTSRWTLFGGTRSSDHVESSVQMPDGSVRVFANSTGQWVGCEDVADTTTFTLDGKYQSFNALAALRVGVPAGLLAGFSVAVDGTVIDTLIVSSGSPVPVQIDVRGAQELTLSAIKTAGECDVGPPYGIWVDGHVTPAEENGLGAMSTSYGNTAVVKVDPWKELGSPALTGSSVIRVSGCAVSPTRSDRVDCTASAHCITSGTDYAKGAWCQSRTTPTGWIPAILTDSVHDSGRRSQLAPETNPLALELADGRVCTFHTGAGPTPPTGYGAWAGSCGLSDVLWANPLDGGVEPNKGIFVDIADGYLRIATGPEGSAPQLANVEEIRY